MLPAFPVTGINSTMLTVTGVEPGAGPFSGGTSATLRGSGFDDSVVIRVGGIEVEASGITRDSKNRITIVVPAGKVGPADIEVTRGDTTVVLRDGFIYNALAVSPAKGAAAGGSLVELTAGGARFADDTIVEFDGEPCTELRLDTPQRVICKTPQHAPGSVDVVARSASNSTPPLIAKNSYEFAETLNSTGGGLSGGPINGTLNVTVVSDGSVNNVIPGALVLLGNDPKTAQRGITDARGSVTFSKGDLKGPVSVHATAHCFLRTSIVDFDASDVTMFLGASFDPSCQGEGDLGPAVRQLAATVSGELVFPGREEFSVNSWDIVPKPRENEERVAYVLTTQAGYDTRRIAPSANGAELWRVAEQTAILGKRGYRYRITARPAGLAVFALAGIERTDTRQFTPYVMGITHNVVTSPGEETQDINLSMNITLDRELDIGLAGFQRGKGEDGLDEFRVRSYLDLGGEGLVIRDIGNTSLDSLRRPTGTELFRFLGQPALSGDLADSSYTVLAGYFTTETVGRPYTRQKRSGVRQDQGGEPVRFDNFLGVPALVSPDYGTRIPDDRMLRFDLPGDVPDLILVDIFGGDDTLVWTEILPGTTRAVPLPDFSLIEGQSDIAPGFVRWMVTAVKIDHFKYNELDYNTYVSGTRYWTHDSANLFYARR
ncbi:MAG TPA: IPT/TIG domain-containing protein [Polyangiales bacterium]|nr:IPT/TIG domain-containing protein [Polyangiales bacterium]